MFELKNILMNEDNNSGGSAGGGIDVQAAVRVAVEDATKALNEKNKQLLSELKETRESAKKYDGLDIEKLQSLQKLMEDNEEAKLLADGKIDDVFNRRFARVNEDNASRYNALEEKYTEQKERGDKFESLYAKERIRNQAIRAAEKSGVDPNAIDDVVDKVLGRFSLADDGSLEARDEAGLIMSKDGKTVLQPSEFIDETLKKKYPYYWPTSTSGGLSGGRGGTNGVGNVDDQRLADAAKTKNMKEFRELRRKQRSIS